ncbi:threonine aldolase [Fusarium albosuccineum]|uniref:Threonine aldolase n=1 Tax=Fusarium albosuccineum TaxID=1237068 RepID=A0A8H4LD50_9HYPO|nr:threonine aldolase [Fusarium albosuccineum]
MANTSVSSNRAFMSDNTAGASPEVVKAIAAAASGHALPYGNDDSTTRVRRRLDEVFECKVDLFPVSSGTAANCIGLAALRPPWGSIFCHQDSHINNDECGAPEALTDGAKLVVIPSSSSKIDPIALSIAVKRKVGDVHSVQPAVLSISQPIENGSVYTVEEIRQLSRIAKDAGLRVHMDGARFANALDRLGVSAADMTWRAGVDILSFGLTKNGAMTVDAIISFDPQLAPALAFRQKRAGQLASKMRFHTAQIEAYLTDELWLRNAHQMAARLSNGIKLLSGPELVAAPEANILFCRLSQHTIQGLLADGYKFYHDRWEAGTVRFVTSFSHTSDDVDELIAAVRRNGGA